MGRTVHEVRLVLPLGEGVVLGRAVAHVGVRPVELVGVAHVHAGAVLPGVVVDHVNAGVADGGAPVAGLVALAGQAAARVGMEAIGGGLVEGALVLVLGAQVPVHVDRAPAPVRLLIMGLWDEWRQGELCWEAGPRTCPGSGKTP